MEGSSLSASDSDSSVAAGREMTEEEEEDGGVDQSHLFWKDLSSRYLCLKSCLILIRSHVPRSQ
jgi:hypothetical protein